MRPAHAAIEYVLERQEGKRNATPQDLSYSRGKLLDRRKKKRGNPTGANQHSKPEETRQNDGNPSSGDTASSVGSQTGVSGRTSERDAEYSAALSA
ncbi:MAG: hypothetical protein M3R38_27315 [Actinomycetota bacterium]|nr:hypothetical protein [Actinomycetota bacterium]